jgi:hypothetical protein
MTERASGGPACGTFTETGPTLRALLPDPQLHGRLSEGELQLLDLGALPAFDQTAAAAGLAGHAVLHRRLAGVDQPLRHRLIDSADTP